MALHTSGGAVRIWGTDHSLEEKLYAGHVNRYDSGGSLIPKVQWMRQVADYIVL